MSLKKNHGFNSVQGCCPLNFYMLEILPIPLVKMYLKKLFLHDLLLVKQNMKSYQECLNKEYRKRLPKSKIR